MMMKKNRCSRRWWCKWRIDVVADDDDEDVDDWEEDVVAEDDWEEDVEEEDDEEEDDEEDV
jgi:hypothetical protein